MNQPHKHYSEKNELIVELDNVFANAEYLFPITSNKVRKDVVNEYLFKTVIGGDPSFIIVHEMEWGDFVIHSVTDSENILKGRK